MKGLSTMELNGSANSLLMPAVACLREAIMQIQHSPVGGWMKHRDLVDRLATVDPPAAGAPLRRLTIGRHLPAAVRLFLAATNGANGTANARRLLRSQPPELPLGARRRAQSCTDDGSVRSVPVDLPVMILTGSAAVLPARWDGPARAPDVFLTRDEYAVGILIGCHNLLWSAAGTRAEMLPVPPHLEDVMAELATGVTDAVAARRLHVSKRTVSRRMGEALDYLGATSRFQAGILASRTELV